MSEQNSSIPEGVTFDSTPAPASQTSVPAGVTFDSTPTPATSAPSKTAVQAPAASPKAGVDLPTVGSAVAGGAGGLYGAAKGGLELAGKTAAYALAGTPHEDVMKQLQDEDEANKHKVYAKFKDDFRKGNYKDAMAGLTHLFTDAPSDPNDPIHQMLEQQWQQSQQAKARAMESAKEGDYAGVVQHSIGVVPIASAVDAAMENFRKNPTRDNLKEVVANGIQAFIPTLARGAGKLSSMAKESVAGKIGDVTTPVTEESPMGAQIPVRQEGTVAKAVATHAPEEATKFAQTRTAPAVQKAIGGTVGEAAGSNAATAITAEDRFGLKGHADDIIENQSRPAFKRVDELSGNKLTDAQNKIDSGWGQMDKAKIAEGMAEKRALYDQYRDQLKSEGMDIDTAESSYAKGKAVERMAKRLDAASVTKPSDVEGLRYELNGDGLRTVIDKGVKDGSWKRMGLTDDHIAELESLGKTMSEQGNIPKGNAMLKGLGKLAVAVSGLHYGMLPAIEAVTGMSAADYLGSKVSKRIMQDAMMNYDATQALNEAVKTGDAQPVVDALSKDPSWVSNMKGYVKDTVKRLYKGEAGSAGAPGTVFEPHEIEEMKRIGMNDDDIAEMQGEGKKKSNFSAMVKSHNENGGATFSPSGKDLGGTDAWSVGAYPERTESISGELSPEHINDFVEKNKDLLSKPDHAVGSWKDTDNGQHVLDVTRLIKDDAEAKAVGAAADQKAIYHLKRGELADTGGTGGELAVEPKTTANLSSPGAEGAGSAEAISRTASQKAAGLQFYDVDSRMAGSKDAWHPIMAGVDVADRTAQPFHHIVEFDPKTGATTLVDSGKGAKPLPSDERIQAMIGQATPETPATTRPEVAAEAAYRASLAQKEVGTRYPSSAKAETANNPSALSGLEALNEADRQAPARITQEGKPVLGIKQKLVAALQDYKDNGISNLLDAANPDVAIEKFVEHAKENLKWLHDATPEVIRDSAHRWYETAHETTKKLAEDNGINHEQSSAVTAVLSPQNDWNNNIGQARRIVEHWKNDQNHAWTPDMDGSFAQIRNGSQVSEPMRRMMDTIRGKRYNQLTAKNPDALLAKKAMWIRVLDAAHNTPDTPIYSPDGTVQGSQTLAWNSVDPMAKALSILEDGSIDNINSTMGMGHKVRNFYNNIINPWSERGHVTVDTHQVGASLLKPFSGDDLEVAHNFGSGNRAGIPSPAKHAGTGLKGSYPVYEEAVRRAAKELGLQPRELQSITWEGIRSLMGDEKKTPELRRAVRDIWRAHEDGQLTLNDAREEILKASGGFSKPNWISDEQWEKSGGKLEPGQTDFSFGANQ